MTDHFIDNVTALILAGGQGSRMDGADKGLVLFAGLPLIVHAVEKLRPRVQTTLISANRNLAVYAGFGCQVVQDSGNDFPGPLAGVQAGLQHCLTPLLLVVPCDVPGFPASVVDSLYKALSEVSADVAVVRNSGHLQSAFLLMKKSVLPSLQQYLDSGRRSIHGWLDALTDNGLSVCPVDIEAAPDCFANLNTTAELLAHEPPVQFPDDDV